MTNKDACGKASARISVCMATFNGAPYVEQQVRSILFQLGSDDELVVSDDGSRDATLELIAAFGDSRVRILPSHPPFGIVKNFEHAIRNCTGRYIFLSDQDDVWIDGKVDACLKALANADLVVTDCLLVDEKLNVLEPSYFSIRGGPTGVIGTLVRNRYMGCCMAFRRKILAVALPFPAAIPMHDSWLGLIASSIGRVEFLRHPFLLYRRHATTATHYRARRLHFKQVTDRLRLSFALVSRLLEVRKRKLILEARVLK